MEWGYFAVGVVAFDERHSKKHLEKHIIRGYKETPTLQQTWGFRQTRTLIGVKYL